jgi:hypothetical protein
MYINRNLKEENHNKVNGKFFSMQTVKAYVEGGDVGPAIRNFVTGCNGMVRHPRRCCFTYGGRTLGAHRIGGWMGQRAGSEGLGTETNLSFLFFLCLWIRASLFVQ